MNNAGLRLAIIIATVYAIFTGFVAAIIVDESVLPGATQMIVQGPTTASERPEVSERLQKIAQESQTLIIREIRDLHETNVRNYFMAVGDDSRPETRWLYQGYPGFSQGITSTFRPMSQMHSRDLAGTYYVFGNSSDVRGVASDLTALGLETTFNSPSSGSVLLLFLEGSLGLSTLVLLLLLVLLVGTSVVTRAKGYAIFRLHGVSKIAAITKDWQKQVAFVLCTFAISLVCLVIGLWFYNRLHQAHIMLLGSALALLILLSVILCTHWLVLHLSWNAPLVQAIKGRLGFSFVAPAAYAIRLPALALAVLLVASTFASAQAVRTSAQTLNRMQHVGDASTIIFDSLATPTIQGQVAQETGAWLREQDMAGQILMAIPSLVKDAKSGEELSILVVNNSYLDQNQILDSSGHQVAPVTRGQVKALLPDDVRVDPQGLLDLIPQISAQTTLSSAIPVETIRSGQEHDLYEPTPDTSGLHPAWSINPIVIVSDADSALFSNEDYMSHASSGRLVILDPEQVITTVPEELLSTWVSAFIPIKQLAADRYNDHVLNLKISMASMVVALLVLLATVLAVTQIHVRSNAQSILVRYLHGWTFRSIHRALLRTETITLGVLVLFSGGSILITWLTEKLQGGDPAPGTSAAMTAWQPWAVLIIGVLNIALLLSVLQFKTNHLIRSRSEDTV